MVLKILINIFLVFSLIILTNYCITKESALWKEWKLLKRYKNFITWLGLGHSWSMFAPKPPVLEKRIECEIKYKNGDWEAYTIPCFQGIGESKWPKKLKYRKLLYNILKKKAKSKLWCFCEFLKKDIKKKTGKRVTAIRIYKVTNYFVTINDGEVEMKPSVPKKELIYEYPLYIFL